MSKEYSQFTDSELAAIVQHISFSVESAHDSGVLKEAAKRLWANDAGKNQ